MLRYIFVVLSLLSIPGCTSQDLLDKLIPKDKVEFSQSVVSEIKAHNFGSIEFQLDPSLKGPQAMVELEKIASLFPPQEAISIEVIGSNTFLMNGDWKGAFTFQYHYPDKWLLVNVNLSQPSGKPLLISGINVQPISDSLQNINRVDFYGKPFQHYAMLIVTALMPLFVLYVLILAIRTRFPRRKWLWLIFIGCGICTVSLDWTSGLIRLQPLSFLVLGSAFFKGTYGPLMLSTSVPLGAILFLFKRKKWQ